MKVSYKGFTAEEWADRFDEQRQTLCTVQEALQEASEEKRKLLLQIDAKEQMRKEAADALDAVRKDLIEKDRLIERMKKVVDAAEALADAKRGQTVTMIHEAVKEYRQQSEKPLCECGHNHRTYPGHYVTMNCNSAGCGCTYYTEKRVVPVANIVDALCPCGCHRSTSECCGCPGTR